MTAIPAIVLAALVWAANLTSAHAESRRCDRFEGVTLERTVNVRVTRHRGRTFACSYQTGRRMRLGDRPLWPDFERAAPIRIAGDRVAYQIRLLARTDQVFEVRVIDVRKRKLELVTAANETLGPGDRFIESPGVTDLVLTPAGMVGWITRDPFVPGGQLEVRKFDARGVETLARGPAIATGSLAASGAELYWREDGTARSYSWAP